MCFAGILSEVRPRRCLNVNHKKWVSGKKDAKVKNLNMF